MNFYPIQIARIIDQTPSAYTLIFEQPAADIFPYQAGQYLTIAVEVEGQTHRRAYSLSSSPVIDDQWAVTLKRLAGGVVSNYLRDHLSVGDTVQVAPPAGGFILNPQRAKAIHHIMIGGGSGISPLMSMLRTILIDEPQSSISLWYGNRTEEEIIFYRDLAGLQTLYSDRLFVYHSLTQPPAGWQGGTGRLTEEVLYDRILHLFMEDEFAKKFYLCGPSGLIDAAEAALERHAVHPINIAKEYYVVDTLQLEKPPTPPTPVKPSWETQPVSIRLHTHTHELTVPPEQTILDAAVAADLDPPYTCMGGTCSSCKAKLKSGQVYMDRDWGLSEAEKAAGFVLTCQAHPLSDDVVLDWDV